VSCAKTAELIEMLLGILNQVSPENHVLAGGAFPWEGALLWDGLDHCKAYNLLCADVPLRNYSLTHWPITKHRILDVANR